MVMKRWMGALGALAVAALICGRAGAGELDASKDVICAVFDVVACGEDSVCLQGRASSFDLPEFVVVDAKRQVLRGSQATEKGPASTIKNREIDGKEVILQGVENGRGWNVAIDTTTGKMSASLVGDAVSFLAFGACTAP